MKILTQNKKMKKSSQNGIEIYNFGIPAFKSETGLRTCPKAKQCAAGCYATMGAYVWSNVRQAYEKRLALTQSDTFIHQMQYEIAQCLKKVQKRGNQCIIRIHDSGDFYSDQYIDNWITIMQFFASQQDIRFYAYTKMVQKFKSMQELDQLPDNFNIIYSYGGSEDSHIDTSVDRHSKVFQTETELLDAGYADASQDDTVAALGANHRIGLIYHGSKNYANTSWANVK